VYITPEVRIMKVKDQILKLRDLGYSYRQIQEKLHCSKGTIAYHCGDGQKDKTTKRRNKNRSYQHPLVRKVENFVKIIGPNNQINIQSKRTLNKILYQKIAVFSRINHKDYNYMSFTVEALLEKIGNNPMCSLTGRPINLLDSRSYQLDHIVPRSKGGDNSLDNCQLTCREANQAKHELTIDEFINLCREIINYHDHKIKAAGAGSAPA
jgi:5-methylcytosine-specific restriction endonuclease McrA